MKSSCTVAGAGILLALQGPALSSDDQAGAARLIHDAQAGLSLRGSYWSHSRLLDGDRGVASASAWATARARVGTTGKLVFDGWARNDRSFDVRPGDTDIREAYGAASFGQWDLSAGRQLIVWGKADAVNPTDVISVRNFTLLTPTDEDQKTGVGTVRATYNREDLRLTALWLPEFRANTLPLPPTPGVRFEERDPSRPYQQWALRAERSSERIDWSASYFDGYDKSPDLRADSAGASGVLVGLYHSRIRVLGADAATTLGRWGVRTEAAYTWTSDPDGTDPFTKNPFFYGVLGVDRTFLDNLNVNVQALYRRIAHYEDPFAVTGPLQPLAVRQALISNQRDPEQVGATLRISKKWWNDTLEAEVSAITWFVHGDSLVRPRVKYAWTDRLKTTLGADFYRGPVDSFFGSLRDLSTAFVEVQYDL